MTANYSNSSSVGMFSETYNYDSNGNMLRHIRETNPLTMSYSGNRLASAGNAAFEYDAKGRLVLSAYGNGLSTLYNIIDLPQRQTTRSVSTTSPPGSCTPASAASRRSILLQRNIRASVRMPTVTAIR